MTQTQFFEWLGAPLSNTRWSWGSVRGDNVIFLRAWQDETIKHNGMCMMRITRHSAFIDDKTNLGYQERLSHIELIRMGYECYVVMCEPVLEKLPTRVIKDFNSDEVFKTGTLVEIDGDVWIELLTRIPAKSIRKTF